MVESDDYGCKGPKCASITSENRLNTATFHTENICNVYIFYLLVKLRFSFSARSSQSNEPVWSFVVSSQSFTFETDSMSPSNIMQIQGFHWTQTKWKTHFLCVCWCYKSEKIGSADHNNSPKWWLLTNMHWNRLLVKVVCFEMRVTQIQTPRSEPENVHDLMVSRRSEHMDLYVTKIYET